jgi:amino acid transporter
MMTVLHQVFNLIIGLVSIVIIILAIAGGAFWLGNKLNKDDRYK